MQLGRHHDKLTVCDETIVAHPDGSTVDVMDVKGDVVIRGKLHIERLVWYAGDIDMSEDVISVGEFVKWATYHRRHGKVYMPALDKWVGHLRSGIGLGTSGYPPFPYAPGDSPTPSTAPA